MVNRFLLGSSWKYVDGIKPLEAIIAEADNAMYIEKRRRKADRAMIDSVPYFLPETLSRSLHTSAGESI